MIPDFPELSLLFTVHLPERFRAISPSAAIEGLSREQQKPLRAFDEWEPI
jgi:hypothetical protein